jgi:hypothetical protein
MEFKKIPGSLPSLANYKNCSISFAFVLTHTVNVNIKYFAFVLTRTINIKIKYFAFVLTHTAKERSTGALGSFHRIFVGSRSGSGASGTEL